MTGNEIIEWIKDNGLERINMFRPGRKLIAMNAKQSLRAASENIRKLEDFNLRCTNDIKGLYYCIESVIAGEKRWCELCQDQEECQREEKGTGCKDWWMRMDRPEQQEGSEADDSQGILQASPTCGE